MRRVIRSAYLGEAPGDLSSLENPQAVEEIKHLSWRLTWLRPVWCLAQSP